MNTQANQSSRRQFLRSTLSAAVALGASQYSLSTWAKPIGANDDIRVAVIGTRSQGGGHIGRLSKMSGCRLVAICDVDTVFLDKHKEALAKSNVNVETYVDYRKLLENPDIDAVVIATPNHLHTLIGVTALAQGKHVYIEKPVSHNVWEGRKLAEASKKRPNLIAMHGMQRRSDKGWAEVMEWAKSEPIGKMTLSRGLNFKARKSIGKVEAPVQAPSTVDYNLWSGPREVLPIRRQQFHYDWHWQWAYGNGDIGNQGPHQLDIARWAIGDQTHPVGVVSAGGRFGYDDDGETANTQIAIYDYNPVRVVFDNRGLPNKDMNWGQEPVYKNARIGNIIHFEGGYVSEGAVFDNDNKRIQRFPVTGGGDHLGNFLKAIRQGKLLQEGDGVEQGHYSAALAHLSNISYRLGKQVAPGEIRERFKNDAAASELYELMSEHLANNGVNLDQNQPILGPHLKFNPSTEQFEGEFAEEANKLLTDTYRDEFKLPEIS